jgi:hypothetical protein
MNPTIASLLVQEHVNDLIREAQHRRRYVEVRRRRRTSLIPPRLSARPAPRYDLTVAPTNTSTFPPS